MPVTVAIFDRTLPATLWAMVEALIARGGKVELISGRLVVSLPAS